MAKPVRITETIFGASSIVMGDQDEDSEHDGRRGSYRRNWLSFVGSLGRSHFRQLPSVSLKRILGCVCVV